MINLFLSSFILSLILTNITINFFTEKNIKQAILEDAPKSHLAKRGTPTMGGIALVITILLFMLTQRNSLNYYIIISLFLLVGFGLIGFIDDVQKVMKNQNKGLSAKSKFFLQLMVASAFSGFLAGANHYASVQGLLSYLPYQAYYVLVVFIIVGCSNAVNLTDGLDGLAGGTLLIAFLGLVSLTYLIQEENISFYFLIQSDNLIPFIVIVMGALFGFLWFNVHPARIFMGDTGSLSFGALLAGISIILHKELLLGLLGIIFVVEALSVMIQVSFFKITKGKRIFKMAPLHHHFELSGWTENKIVIRFWIFSIIMLLVAIKFRLAL